MTYKMIIPVCVVTVFVCLVITGTDARQLPIKNCSTDEMDVLFLYSDGDKMNLQKAISQDFVQHLLSSPDNRTIPRLMFAAVCETFFPQINPSNANFWTFLPTLQPDPYRFNSQQPKIWQYKDVEETVRLKGQFVHSLFSVMKGVRKNVIRVAVIFLDCVGAPQDGRRVSLDVQQQDSGIHIFVMSVCDVSFSQRVCSNDIYQPGNDLSRRTHLLPLQICSQCKTGWFLFKHSYGTDSVSCYKLIESGYTSSDTAPCIANGANLASIESLEELTFLRARMYSYFKETRNLMSDLKKSQFLVHFGLRRESNGVTKRYKWFLQFQTQLRPVLINNWKPGKSSPGFKGNCAVWEFVWNKANSSSNEDNLFDYWTAIECWNKINSFSLCEVILPRISEPADLMVIKPAVNESIGQALEKGHFMEFRGEIISVSANIGRNDVLKEFRRRGHKLYSVFDCGKDAGDPRYISFMFVCDNTRDCNNGRDENVCAPRHQDWWNSGNSDGNNCGGVYCCDGSCLHLRWVNDGVEDCPVFKCGTDQEISDEYITLNKYLNKNQTCAIICDNNKCVNSSQLNDGQNDCTGPEGPLDETIGKLEAAGTCYNILNESVWAPKCVYVKDMFGAVLGCRDMSHLENCTDYECPLGYSKCPKSYCIPQHYILDGDSDCPTGEDELNDNNDCFGNFRCSNSKICLYPDRVCDAHTDCPRHDDELDCRISCPPGFRCVSGTITVSDYNKSDRITSFIATDARTRHIDLSGLDLSFLESVSFPDNLQTLIWSNCKLKSFPNVSNFLLYHLYNLDISNNLMKNLSDTIIKKIINIRYLNLSFNRELNDTKYLWLQSLEVLDLSYTGLSYLDKSIQDMSRLSTLNLSWTGIVYVSEDTFSFNSFLQTLDLRGVTLKNVPKGLFRNLTIGQHLYVDSFQLCCPQIRGANILSNKCHAPDNAISSCSDLVGVGVQRVLLWLVAVVAVLGNLTVIVYRIIWDRAILRKGYGLFVTNLGISDFIMGVYLFIIAGADHYYRDIYVLYDTIWRESIACRLAGFLVTLSCETSTFFVFLITLDRYLVLKFPFGQIMFSKFNKIATLLFSWMIGFLLAVIPFVFKFEVYSSNAMCLGLPLTTKRLKGWQFSFGVFVVFDLILCFAIAYGQRAIFKAMSENRITETTTKKPSRRVTDIIVGKQLSLIALSNFLCWFPVGIMGLLSLLEYEINDDVYAWTTVIIIPINSAVNPLLYTIPALVDRWNKFKFGD